MGHPNSQKGNTLLVSMVMLTVMTFIAVSAINMTTTNTQILGNLQFQEEALAVAQHAIDSISNTAFKTTAPAMQPVDINDDGEADYEVVFGAPACVYFRPINAGDGITDPQCYGGEVTLCYMTIWELTATATDPRTGASARVTQGIQALAGLNDYLDDCP